MHDNCKLFAEIQDLKETAEKKDIELMQTKHELKQLSQENKKAADVPEPEMS